MKLILRYTMIINLATMPLSLKAMNFENLNNIFKQIGESNNQFKKHTQNQITLQQISKDLQIQAKDYLQRSLTISNSIERSMYNAFIENDKFALYSRLKIIGALGMTIAISSAITAYKSNASFRSYIKDKIKKISAPLGK